MPTAIDTPPDPVNMAHSPDGRDRARSMAAPSPPSNEKGSALLRASTMLPVDAGAERIAADAAQDDTAATWIPLRDLDFEVDDVDQSQAAEESGHNLMDRAVINREIAASGAEDGFDHLSSGEEQRIRFLQHTARSPLFRRSLIGTDDMLDRLRALDAAAPNFQAVTRLVQNAVTLSKVGVAPIRLPPMLMVGAPGTGKTRYAHALAAAIGTVSTEITGTSLSDAASLTGYGPAWRSAGPGRIAKALIATTTTAPLIIIDECEKVRDYERKEGPLDVLLPLLEAHTAARFVDDYVRVPMRADQALWLFACNSTDGLSPPVLNRVVTLRIPDLDPSARDAVLDTMMAEASRAAGVKTRFADAAARAGFAALGLRRARLAMAIAIASAVAAGRRFISEADAKAAAALLGEGERASRMGFIDTHGDAAGLNR
ncbi:AAA family ATPase [Lichenihabitans sp. Uapishka_5]|uniref:AAA family ATPase n=1 Tax=Lichenihabitans sp. Uapishka_5 TaxID=3037302 RepID=UPI0029E7E2EE|nr:AAA family ATPase [Lichenihabitans sp. Uapishka_5]MDX7953471.1 AAA family ATPase [Lichenihabitans sp. Uapishka_5]